ncbi:dihydrofolate reductase [Lutibaculum baratangense]|nr:dihydrofolate reductase [Lutibaculum baratangense]
MTEGLAGGLGLPIVLVAAVGENGVIGAQGDMPWRLPSDLRHFKDLTMGQPVVMGRKTFLSIGKPLSGRVNVVVSGPTLGPVEGIERASTLEEGLRLAGQAGRGRGARMIAVIGGGQIYAQTIDLADRLEITRVAVAPEGDTFFPMIDEASWREVARRGPVKGETDTAAVTFLTYERR